MKNLTLARIRTLVPGFSSADALATKPGMPVAEPEFLSFWLSDLKLTPLPSLHVDISRHVVTECFHNLSTVDYII